MQWYTIVIVNQWESMSRRFLIAICICRHNWSLKKVDIDHSMKWINNIGSNRFKLFGLVFFFKVNQMTGTKQNWIVEVAFLFIFSNFLWWLLLYLWESEGIVFDDIGPGFFYVNSRVCTFWVLYVEYGIHRLLLVSRELNLEIINMKTSLKISLSQVA